MVCDIAHVAHPLTQLTCEDMAWHWGSKEQEAFDTLKAHVTSEPILTQPDLVEQFILEVNASGYAVGAVLLLSRPSGTLGARREHWRCGP